MNCLWIRPSSRYIYIQLLVLVYLMNDRVGSHHCSDNSVHNDSITDDRVMTESISMTRACAEFLRIS